MPKKEGRKRASSPLFDEGQRKAARFKGVQKETNSDKCFGLYEQRDSSKKEGGDRCSRLEERKQRGSHGLISFLPPTLTTSFSP